MVTLPIAIAHQVLQAGLSQHENATLQTITVPRILTFPELGALLAGALVGDGTLVEIRVGPKSGEGDTAEKVEMSKGEGGGLIATVRYPGALNRDIEGQARFGISSVPSAPADSEVIFTPASTKSEAGPSTTRHSDEWYKVAPLGKEGYNVQTQAEAISQHPVPWFYEALDDNEYAWGSFRRETPHQTNPYEPPSAALSKEKENMIEQLPGYHYNPNMNEPYLEGPFSRVPASMENIGNPPDYWIGSGPCPPAFSNHQSKSSIAKDIGEEDMRLHGRADTVPHLSPEERRARDMAAAKKREEARRTWVEQVPKGPEHVPRAGETTRFTLRKGRFVPVAVPSTVQEKCTRKAYPEPSSESNFSSRSGVETLIKDSDIPRHGKRQTMPHSLPKVGSGLPINVRGSGTSRIPTSHRDSSLSEETFVTWKNPHVESSPELPRHAQNLGISDLDHGFSREMCAARIERLKMAAAQVQDPRNYSWTGPADVEMLDNGQGAVDGTIMHGPPKNSQKSTSDNKPAPVTRMLPIRANHRRDSRERMLSTVKPETLKLAKLAVNNMSPINCASGTEASKFSEVWWSPSFPKYLGEEMATETAPGRSAYEELGKIASTKGARGLGIDFGITKEASNAVQEGLREHLSAGAAELRRGQKGFAQVQRPSKPALNLETPATSLPNATDIRFVTAAQKSNAHLEEFQQSVFPVVRDQGETRRRMAEDAIYHRYASKLMRVSSEKMENFQSKAPETRAALLRDVLERWFGESRFQPNRVYDMPRHFSDQEELRVVASLYPHVFPTLESLRQERNESRKQYGSAGSQNVQRPSTGQPSQLPLSFGHEPVSQKVKDVILESVPTEEPKLLDHPIFKQGIAEPSVRNSMDPSEYKQTTIRSSYKKAQRKREKHRLEEDDRDTDHSFVPFPASRGFKFPSVPKNLFGTDTDDLSACEDPHPARWTSQPELQTPQLAACNAESTSEKLDRTPESVDPAPQNSPNETHAQKLAFEALLLGEKPKEGKEYAKRQADPSEAAIIPAITLAFNQATGLSNAHQIVETARRENLRRELIGKRLGVKHSVKSEDGRAALNEKKVAAQFLRNRKAEEAETPCKETAQRTEPARHNTRPQPDTSDIKDACISTGVSDRAAVEEERKRKEKERDERWETWRVEREKMRKCEEKTRVERKMVEKLMAESDDPEELLWGLLSR